MVKPALHHCRGGREAGFTYLGLIILVAIIGLVGAATLKVDALMQRAAAEKELLEIGAAFGDALRSYADATPRGQPTRPPSLQDLLKDPRYPGVRRHLRKIFVDPITGKAEWGIVYAGQVGGLARMGGATGAGAGVLAVYSLSQDRPLKVANFDERFQNFENKEHLSDWRFAASGQAVSEGGAPPQPGQAGQPGAIPGQPGSMPGKLPGQAPGQPPGQAQAQSQGQTQGQGQDGQPASGAPQPSLFPGRGARAPTLPASASTNAADAGVDPAAAPPAQSQAEPQPDPQAQPAATPPSEASGPGKDDENTEKDEKNGREGEDSRRNRRPPETDTR